MSLVENRAGRERMDTRGPQEGIHEETKSVRYFIPLFYGFAGIEVRIGLVRLPRKGSSNSATKSFSQNKPNSNINSMSRLVERRVTRASKAASTVRAA